MSNNLPLSCTLLVAAVGINGVPATSVTHMASVAVVRLAKGVAAHGGVELAAVATGRGYLNTAKVLRLEAAHVGAAIAFSYGCLRV